MAREIVITSVPRGVKLGRTGFQVAMQTAGMREDVAAVLEKMAGYRHLPAGAGANPVCYFHRVARTVAGQMHVLGRIVDAGVDFSNRSNKLAHMVVLEAADLSAVAAASPAAVLAAIEGRLASTWPGGPEERRQPFALAGIPPSQPAVCGLWQQVMGDAGWAGVIAERAVRNEPTLLIGPDSSPASCRRMLALFAEAIAIVPPAKRWGVTFDTTTLVADGVLWRGTYAGSPESQVAQPGVLIINLSAPQPVPQNLLAGELVQVARVGAPALPVGGLPVPPGGVPTARGLPVIGNPLADAAKTAATGGPGAPPPAPFNEDEWEDVPLGGSGRKRGAGGGLLVAGIVFALVAVLGIAVVGGFFVWTNVFAPSWAMQRIRDYADSNEKAKRPKLEDVCTALRIDPQSQEADLIKANLPFLEAVLASEKVPAKAVESAKSLREMLDAIETVTTVGAADSKARWPLLLGQDVESGLAEIAAGLHPKPFSKDYGEFQGFIDSCRKLVALAGEDEKSRQGASIDDRLWQELEKQAQQKDPGRDYAKGRDTFIASVDKESVKSLDALIGTVVKSSPTNKKEEPVGEPKDTQTASAATAEAHSTSAPPQPPAAPSPDEAFAALREKIADFRKSNKTISVEPEKGTALFEIAPALAKALDAEVVVGSREGLDLKAKRDATQPTWMVVVGEKKEEHVATIDLTGGKVVVKRGSEAAWNKHWPTIRFMPIAFCRPGQTPSADDWLVLSQPEQLKLASEKTLHNLFFAKDGCVPLPPGMEGIDWSAVSATPWTPRAYPSSDGSLTAKVLVAGKEAFLEIIAKIGERAYTLAEPLVVRGDQKQIVTLGGSWSDRPVRASVLEGMALANEIQRLGFGNRNDMPQAENDLPDIVIALLDRNDGNPVTIPAARQSLAVWSEAKKPGDIDYKKYDSLEAWRECLRKYIKHTRFGAKYASRYEVQNPKPDDPGTFKEPPREQGEDEKKYDEKVKSLREEHQKKERRWNEWHELQTKFVSDSACSSAELRDFLVENGKDGGEDVSAIKVLLGLDGLIVAKVKRKQLEELLHRIPIAALFEGDVNQKWTVKDLGEVRVPVARLEPAELLKLPETPPPSEGPTP